jgi:glycosyltransferase involved in cell wall biosynthesis
MMKFLLDGRHIQDHFPGIGRYVFNLAAGLARVASYEEIRLLYNPGRANTRYDFRSLSSSRNLELVPVGPHPGSLREQVLGVNRKLTSDAALWHSGYYVMPYVLPVPAVLTLEDVMPLVLHETMPGALKRSLYRGLSMVAASRAERVITISESASADVRRSLGIRSNKLSVIPLAADAAFHPREAAQITPVRDRLGLPEHYVLYVGSNKPHKNLERLVLAWARVVCDAALVIAGHWESRYPEARRLVEELGLTDRVLFRHDLTNDDLPLLVGGAQVFVFPSIYEGFGLPPLEAMASGTPVVCSNASSLPEVVGKAALLFNPFAVDAITSSLTRVIEDGGLRDALRAKGLAQARCFSWDRTARETLEVYSRVVNGH